MKNTVELLGYYGSDEIIACSAWTSTSRDLTDEKRKRIPKLISNLWKDGHETPFEKGVVHFLVDSDIASHIHKLKHRISSLNGESARYKELKEDKYYLPEDWRGTEVGAYWYSTLKEHTERSNYLYHNCLGQMEEVVGRKRAKESARYFKTYNTQIQSDIMFNMRSFANFLELRNSVHAQLEIKDIAREMLSLIEKIDGSPFKYTLKAFNDRRKTQ